MGHETLTTPPFKGDFFVNMLGHHIAYLCAKFDRYSYSRFGDMIGAHQNLNGSRDLTTPLSEIICHPRTSTCNDQPIYQN